MLRISRLTDYATVILAARVRSNDHPMTFRENRSITTAKYTNSVRSRM